MSNNNAHDEIKNDHFVVKIKTTTIKKYRYDVYFLSNITSAHEYIDFFDLLEHAKKDDEIHVFINNGGGRCRTALQMMNTMKKCPATITCYASGMIASAATWIFLAGDHFIIEDDIEFMCHYYSGGMFGKGNEMEADAEFSKKYYHRLFKKIYKGFMSDDEIKRLIEGKDYYFTQQQVAKRLKNKNKYLKTIEELEKEDNKDKVEDVPETSTSKKKKS